MAKRKKEIPKYGTVMRNGVEYYRTRIQDADGQRVSLYAKTPEELYDKVEEAKKQIAELVFRRETPTVTRFFHLCVMMYSTTPVCILKSICVTGSTGRTVKTNLHAREPIRNRPSAFICLNCRAISAKTVRP